MGANPPAVHAADCFLLVERVVELQTRARDHEAAGRDRASEAARTQLAAVRAELHELALEVPITDVQTVTILGLTDGGYRHVKAPTAESLVVKGLAVFHPRRRGHVRLTAAGETRRRRLEGEES